MNVEVCRRNLLDLSALLDSANIPFMLVFGTLLGAYRDHVLMPHDTDVDIAIMKSEMGRLDAVLTGGAFKESGLTVMRRMLDLVSVSRDGEYVDIYLFHPDGQRYVASCYWVDRNTMDERFEIEFLGRRFMTVRDPEQYLSLHYGPDWKTMKVGCHAQF